MPKNKITRYFTFGSLYFTQGTILGFFAALNALYLLDNGLQMTDVGIFGFIALLPFVLKIGLGILSDRINLFGMGHRKPYIFIGLAVQFLCLVAAPFINPGTHFWGYVALAFTMQLGMALYDTCTDGLALYYSHRRTGNHPGLYGWWTSGWVNYCGVRCWVLS